MGTTPRNKVKPQPPAVYPQLGPELSNRAVQEKWPLQVVEHVAAQLAVHPDWHPAGIITVPSNPQAATVRALQAKGIASPVPGTQYVQWRVRRGPGQRGPNEVLTAVGVDPQTSISGAAPSTGVGDSPATTGAATATAPAAQAAKLSGGVVGLALVAALVMLA